MQHPEKQTENPSCPPCPSATHSLLMGRALTDDSDFTCARQARSTNAPPYNLQKPKGSPVKVLVPDRIRDLLKIRFKYLASINIFANYKISNSTRPQNLMNAFWMWDKFIFWINNSYESETLFFLMYIFEFPG